MEELTADRPPSSRAGPWPPSEASVADWRSGGVFCLWRLFEMKPQKFSPAHKSAGFAELICSNILGRLRASDSAAGPFERGNAAAWILCSLPVPDKTARARQGGALAVDSRRFSERVTKAITEHPNIDDHARAKLTEIPRSGRETRYCKRPVERATPLAEQNYECYAARGAQFFRCRPRPRNRPRAKSLDMEHCFTAPATIRADDDYSNCPNEV